MAPPTNDPELELPRMTLAEHLDELRLRVLRSVLALGAAMVVAFVNWWPIWVFVRRPYVDAALQQGIPSARLMSLDPGEGFLGTMKVCFLAGVVIAAPIVLWQLWGFVSAGLYPHERRIVRLFFPVSVALFAIGVVFAYLVLIPFGVSFLMGWNVSMGVATDWSITSYLSTCLTMVFGMALLFELPLVMLFLEATDIVSAKTFRKGWRIAMLLAFVVGAILTDPSPVTQVAMALPLFGLYMIGVYGGRFVGEARVPFRPWHAWPILLGVVVLTLLFVFTDELQAWSAAVFSSGPGTPPPPSPTSPPPPPPG